MAENVTTIKQQAAKACDRVALGAINDLFQEAMRADWTLHVSRAGIDTLVGRTLGDAAALAWAECSNALQDLRSMSKVDPRILEAAARLNDLMPPEIPEDISLGRHSAELVNRAKAIRKADSELAELIQTMGLLINIYEANRQLIMARPAA
ncbi:hypothetical protein [Tateyamaria omphalii]|uniref:Uncharacterized protein n=1 Tax=Tateyamaria omphalii TaxID=299262 RepID=A0A1P8MTF7_9RHOB|nr:hypothetical protein [Tateyamaria omphalii]APX11366.1 hypothetical protein BWR18_06485 [Tateyamaria omphalii]